MPIPGLPRIPYIPAKTVNELDATVAPDVVLSYVGLSPRKLNGGLESARQAAQAALPTQQQEIISCVKGQANERYWVSVGKSGDSLKCAVGVESNGKVSAAWFAKNDGDSCQEELVKMAKAALDDGYNCQGR